jgi:hypothetical protein
MSSTSAPPPAQAAISKSEREDLRWLEHNAYALRNAPATAPVAELPTQVDSMRLDSIKDSGAQMRVEMRADTVDEYADAMLGGATFPPIIVFFDGEDYWLGDGFHRVGAARRLERETIVAEIRPGSARDAILHGAGSNATHGLPRTQADKRRAVERLLRDPEWTRWSDRKIAEAARVDHKTVATVRRSLAGDFPTATGPAPKAGDFPTANVKPNDRGSMLADVLKTVDDDLLIAECRRRGLEWEATDA